MADARGFLTSPALTAVPRLVEVARASSRRSRRRAPLPRRRLGAGRGARSRFDAAMLVVGGRPPPSPGRVARPGVGHDPARAGSSSSRCRRAHRALRPLDVRLAHAPAGARRRARRARHDGAGGDGGPLAARGRRRPRGPLRADAQALGLRGVLPRGRARRAQLVAGTRPTPRRDREADADRHRRRPRRASAHREAASRSTPSSGSGRWASSTRSRSTTRPRRCPSWVRAGIWRTIVVEHRIEHVVVTFSTAPNDVLLREVKHCEEARRRRLARPAPAVRVRVTGNLGRRAHRRPAAAHRAPAQPEGLAVRGQVRDRPRRGRRAAAADAAADARRIAVAVRLSVGSPILFRQRRIGLDGREFEMLKFRSMRTGGSLVSVPDLPLADHGAGRHRGRRPAHAGRCAAAAHVARRAAAAPERGEGRDEHRRPAAGAPRVRADVRAQRVPLRGASPRQVGDHRLVAGERPAREDLALGPGRSRDNFYIENWSLWLDLKILLLTLLAVPRAFSQSE